MFVRVTYLLENSIFESSFSRFVHVLKHNEWILTLEFEKIFSSFLCYLSMTRVVSI